MFGYIRAVCSVCVLSLLVCGGGSLQAQESTQQGLDTLKISNQRVKRVRLHAEPIPLDSMPVLEGTLYWLIPSAPSVAEGIAYTLDSAGTSVRFTYPEEMEGTPLILHYRVAPYPLHFSVDALDLQDSLAADHEIEATRYRTLASAKESSDKGVLVNTPFVVEGYAFEQMTVGPSVTPAPGSQLHLSFRGQLTENISLQGVIADHSIPFQPSGTTAHVQALQQIYMKVEAPRWQLQAGDIELHHAPHFPFVRYTLPAQGLHFTFRQNDSVHSPWRAFHVGGGVLRGVHKQVDIVPIDGVQGPYTVPGVHAFTRVVILANSETVYYNGKPLQRGEQFDYIIDYNLGEITFTARCPIMHDTRIHITYKALAQQYTSYALHAGGMVNMPQGWSLAVSTVLQRNVPFTLQGSPNGLDDLRTLQDLAPGETHAWIQPQPQEPSTLQAGYIQVDTLVQTPQGEHTTQVLRYVAHPSAAQRKVLIQPSFTFVGQGQGDYHIAQDSLNQQYFQWVGVSQGAYQPGQLVHTPQCTLLSSLLLQKQWTPQARSQWALVYSLHNTNLVGLPKAQHATQGIASRLAHEQLFTWHDGRHLRWEVNAEFTSPRFHFLQEYYTQEYYRQWGVRGDSLSPMGGTIENSLIFTTPRGVSSLMYAALIRDSIHAHSVHFHQQYTLPTRWRYAMQWQSYGMPISRGKSCYGGVGSLSLSKSWQQWELELASQGECQHAPKLALPSIAHLLDARAWCQTALHLKRTIDSSFTIHTQCAYRYDWAVQPAQLPMHTIAPSLIMHYIQPHKSSVQAHITYRFIRTERTPVSAPSRREHLLAKVDYKQSIAKQRVNMQLSLGFTAEQVPRWQQHFIKVPTGMGRYAWVDSNGDSLQQLYEFTPALFPDQAEYILQRIPAEVPHYAHVGTPSLSLHVTPRVYLQTIDKSTPWWQRVDLFVEVASKQKCTHKAWWTTLIPFYALHDTVLFESQSLLNLSFYINRKAWPLHLLYAWQFSENTLPLVQGHALQRAQKHILELLFSLHSMVSLSTQGKLHTLTHELPFVSIKEYSITLQQKTLEARLSVIPIKECTISLLGQMHWTHQHAAPHHRARWWKGELSLTYTPHARWTLSGSGQYAYMRSTLPAHPAVYQLLEGLASGHNITGTTTVAYRITQSITAQLSYHTRHLGHSPWIHSGFLSIQAHF